MKNIVFIVLVILLSKIVVGQTGPGGVGAASSNGLWLKADNLLLNNNDPVVTWDDASGNTNNATASVTEQPLFISSSTLNNMPAIRFDGNNDIMTVADAAILDGTSGLTYFAVIRPSNLDNTPRPIMGKRLSFSSADYAYSWFFYNNNYLNLDLSTGNNRFDTNPSSFSNATNYLLSFNYDGSLTPTQRSKIYNAGTLNTTSIESSTSIPNSSADLIIGTLNAGDPRQLGADFAELIQFNFSLNTCQTILVNNYLSAKYNIGLTSNDLYDEDDNGDYDFDVAGIGRISATNLNNDGQGSGMVRILNPTNLDDDEFFIWGHDNGVAQAVEYTDVPLGVVSRFDRVWRVSEVNSTLTPINVGDIDVRFDLSNLGVINSSDLRLLIDVDNDGIFSDETPIDGAINISGDIYQFSGVNGNKLSNNIRFTIATINIIETPLPIELVNFTARPSDNKTVQLKWQTASELNNDFFTIERSINAQDWHEVIKTDGAGNSSSLLSYMNIDNQPYDGLSYYRLKQTDFDGKFEYSEIRSVNIQTQGNGQVEIYPNPATNQVVIKGSSDELEEIVLYNTLGQNVTLSINLIENNETHLVIDLSKLHSAMYYLKTKTTITKVFKQ